VNENRFTRAIFAEHPACAFEDDELDVRVVVIFKHHGRASDGGGDSRGIDLGATCIFRDAQKHRPAAELEIARSFAETENRVRAKARHCLVGKGQFGTGIDTGADGGAIAHFVAHDRGARGGLGGHELNVFYHLADTRLFKFGGWRNCNQSKQSKADHDEVDRWRSIKAAKKAIKNVASFHFFQGIN
jgi:hypothetical protein